MLSPSDISKYRQTLMGIAMVGVMFSHWYGFQSINTGVFFLLSSFLVKLVFTEGLLFLSGFGLYYSFSNNSNIKSFYVKRVHRLFIPFLVLSIPLYTFFLIYKDNYSFVIYIEQLTTVYFWIKGNYGGMWYVAVSLFLYLLLPFAYRYLFYKYELLPIVRRALLLIVGVYVINVILDILFPDYFEKIAIGSTKIPIFFLGVLFGYCVKNKLLSSKIYALLVLSFFVIYLGLSFFKEDNQWISRLCGTTQKLFFMPLICLLFNLLHRSCVVRYIIKIFDWFGKYSLELYILHLHFYMFLSQGFLSDNISIQLQATIPMVVAVVLCVPVNRLIAFVNNTIKKTQFL